MVIRRLVKFFLVGKYNKLRVKDHRIHAADKYLKEMIRKIDLRIDEIAAKLRMLREELKALVEEERVLEDLALEDLALFIGPRIRRLAALEEEQKKWEEILHRLDKLRADLAREHLSLELRIVNLVSKMALYGVPIEEFQCALTDSVRS